jgi:hypothetical protein
VTDTAHVRSYQLSSSFGGTITLGLAESVVRTAALDAQVRGVMDAIQDLGFQLQPDADPNSMPAPVIWWSDVTTSQTFEQLYSEPAQ